MAFPSITNVDGTNPGPNSAVPDTPQAAIGNIWKVGVFSLTLVPTTVTNTSVTEQVFASTGIGLLTTDWVWVASNQAQTSVGIVNARVSAADTLNISWVNPSNIPQTPSSTASYTVFVARIQPNWVKPASGNQLDW